MTALTAAKIRKKRNEQAGGRGYGAVKTGATVYQGSLVSWVESTGRIDSASATTGETFAGVAVETKTGNTAGSTYIEFQFGHEELFTTTGATQAYIGCKVACIDSDLVGTFSQAGTAAKQVVCGVLKEYSSTNAFWVKIDPDLGSKSAP